MIRKLTRSFVQAVQEPVRAPTLTPGLPDLARILTERALREAGVPPPAAAERTERAPRAVFIAHGMGQQVPFETLDQVVTAFRDAHARQHLDAPDVRVRQIQRGEQRVARAEFTLRMPDGGSREVHLYEGYWAPLSEGQISAWETFTFLMGAGWAGVKSSLAGGWWRMMFGQQHDFTLTLRTAYAFVLALLVLVSLGVMNGVIVTVTGRLFTGGASPWPGNALLADLTMDFLLGLALCAVLFLVGIGRARRARRRDPIGRLRVPTHATRGFAMACVWATVGVVVLTAVLIGYHLVRHADSHAPRMWTGVWTDWAVGGFERKKVPPLHAGFAIFIWGTVVIASWRSRGFVQQFVGDVAIYVSSHRVNRFAKTREDIQKATYGVARFVYEQQDPVGRPLYDKVFVVGHSLGSVIAYDALNAMIREDLARDHALGVVDRTPLLLTMGSPLDKTAFIFRNQPKHVGDTREALAQSMQPMITSYETRPAIWVNLWSPYDWISGSLEYYDDGACPKNDPQHVWNQVDEGATTPLAAHNEYWDGDRLGNVLYAAIADLPLPLDPRPAEAAAVAAGVRR